MAVQNAMPFNAGQSEDSFAVGVVLYALLISAWPQTKPENEAVTCLRCTSEMLELSLRWWFQ